MKHLTITFGVPALLVLAFAMSAFSFQPTSLAQSHLDRGKLPNEAVMSDDAVLKASGSAQITLTGSVFEPDLLLVTVGTQVTWLNASSKPISLQGDRYPQSSISLSGNKATAAKGLLREMRGKGQAARRVGSQSVESFSATIQPGGAFAHIFGSVGAFHCFDASIPTVNGLVVVLGMEPDATSTAVPTPTPTSTPIATATPVPTDTPTPAPTATPTHTATTSNTPIPTATPFDTPTPTVTPTPNPASATRCGTIHEPETWSPSESPYLVVCDVTVDAGVRLTILPGTEVRFNQATGLNVNGTLAANGTASQPIVFTANADDPSPKFWKQINVSSGGTAALDYAIVRYGGQSYSGAIRNGGGTLQVANTDIADNGFYGVFHAGGSSVVDRSGIRRHELNGIFADGGSLSVAGSTIDGSGLDGIYSNGSAYSAGLSLSVRDSSIGANGQHGIYVRNPLSLELVNSALTCNSGHAVYLYVSGRSLSLTMGANHLSGNGVNGIGLAGQLAYDSILPPAPGTAYVANGLSISAGATFTVSAGAVLKIAGSDPALNVMGSMVALGAPDNPVIFTSLKDDAAAGDTNNNGTASVPARGDWAQIVVWRTTGRVVMEHAIVRYAGQSYSGGIRNNGGFLSIASSTITGNGFYGIYHSGGTTSIQTSSVYGHQSHGVYNATASISVDAQNNWWGSASGPYHPLLNPTGTGDRVGDYVSFQPWSVLPY